MVIIAQKWPKIMFYCIWLPHPPSLTRYDMYKVQNELCLIWMYLIDAIMLKYRKPQMQYEWSLLYPMLH